MRSIPCSLVAIFAFALAACAPRQPAAASPAEGLAGAYAVKLTRADIPAGVPNVVPGEWRVRFHGDGTHVVYHDGRPVVRGSHEVLGDRLIYRSQSGPYACVRSGTHAWRMEDARLLFIEIEDSCTARIATMTARPWSPLR